MSVVLDSERERERERERDSKRDLRIFSNELLNIYIYIYIKYTLCILYFTRIRSRTESYRIRSFNLEIISYDITCYDII